MKGAERQTEGRVRERGLNVGRGEKTHNDKTTGFKVERRRTRRGGAAMKKQWRDQRSRLGGKKRFFRGCGRERERERWLEGETECVAQTRPAAGTRHWKGKAAEDWNQCDGSATLSKAQMNQSLISVSL